MIVAASDKLVAVRGTAARVGITLLNLIQPGLGLLRLAKVRPALAFLIAQLLGFCLLYLIYVFGPTLTFSTWLSIVSFAVVSLLALYGGSIVMTWRGSRQVQPRSGWLWRWHGILAVWLGMLVVTAPLSSAARTHYHNFWVPAVSMVPVLQVGDRFIAQMQGFAPLRRGDVVIVRKGATEYVKRIVALPGDKIMMVGGHIILNGHSIAQGEVGKVRMKVDGRPRTATLLEERLPGEPRAHQIIDVDQTPQDEWPGVQLGDDQFVVMGDNRDNSLDSRFPNGVGGLGVVSRRDIEGRALFRYWRQEDWLRGGAI